MATKTAPRKSDPYDVSIRHFRTAGLKHPSTARRPEVRPLCCHARGRSFNITMSLCEERSFVVENFEESSSVNLHLETGLTYDSMGKEAEAIPHYEKALSIGLPSEKRCVAMLCLGSSYRNVGKLDKSKHILEQAIQEFPEHMGLRCFYALAQYSAGESGQAVGTLLDAILHMSPDTVKPFSKGLTYYRKELVTLGVILHLF